VGLQVTTRNTCKDGYTPIDRMRTKVMNCFGIYLDVDCVSNIDETIDQWETTLKVVVSINKMDYEMAKAFIERTLVNKSLRFWKI